MCTFPFPGGNGLFELIPVAVTSMITLLTQSKSSKLQIVSFCAAGHGRQSFQWIDLIERLV